MKVTITLSPVSFAAGCIVTALFFQIFFRPVAPPASFSPTRASTISGDPSMFETWLDDPNSFASHDPTPPYRQPDPLPSLTNAIPIDATPDDLHLLESLDDDLPEVLEPQPASTDELKSILSEKDDLTKEVYVEQLGDLTPEQAKELMSIRDKIGTLE